MKSKIITAILIAAALVIFSAVLYFNKPTSSKPFNLVGEWKIDSVYNWQGSTRTDAAFGNYLSKRFAKDAFVRFSADSTMASSDTSEAKARYYLKDSTVFVNKDSVFVGYPFKTITTDLFEYVDTKDSIVVVMRRK